MNQCTYALNYSENGSFKIFAIKVFIDTDIEKIKKEKCLSLLMEEDQYTSRNSEFSLEHMYGLMLSVGTSIYAFGCFVIHRTSCIHSKQKSSDQPAKF